MSPMGSPGRFFAQLLTVAFVVSLQAGTSAKAQGQGHPVVVYGWDHPRCPESGSETARRIAECLSSLTDVPVETAAVLCRGARSQDAGRALSQCMRAVLYERSGLGARRKAVDPQSAATACRWALDVPRANAVEECMRRMLFDREGLGYMRTDVSPEAAARACQQSAAPPPLSFGWLPFGWVPLPGFGTTAGLSCRAPQGDEGVRFLSECVRRLVQRKVPGDAAALACEGAVAPWP